MIWPGLLFRQAHIVGNLTRYENRFIGYHATWPIADVKPRKLAIMQIVILVVAEVAGRAELPPVNSKSARTPVLG
jgi:hypothetical protein